MNRLIPEFFAVCVKTNREKKLCDIIAIVELVDFIKNPALEFAKKEYARDDLEIKKIKIKDFEFID